MDPAVMASKPVSVANYLAATVQMQVGGVAEHHGWDSLGIGRIVVARGGTWWHVVALF
jgi:hypothetical protein